MKKRTPKGEDHRKVVIYARKSKVTHKGDSISNQEEYCKDYARLHLNLPEDYEYDIYEDEGKSGFYSDRPDFQQMIHDVERKKIKAIVCYKLDRISRKMSDLANMIDFLNKYDVALLISSNNLNTMDSNSKMMIQMLGMIVEFERDILTERIQDNLSELSKDGRWMGGIPPTGYSMERSKTGRGRSKNSFAFLVPIPEEREMVKHVYELFLETRSYNETAKRLNAEGYRTKTGAEFKVLAVKDLIRNPVYCIADKDSYKYFLDQDCNMFGEMSEYDGIHGISVYNRTTQTKEESDDSTFLRPEFTRYTIQKDEDEWIIAPGRHEGFIPSQSWIDAQKIREEIADKYNRPHRATNALAAGLMYCPYCHVRLTVISESNRYTHGKPRFKYACPNAVRKGSCNYQAVRGVEFDEYLMRMLPDVGKDKEHAYHKRLVAMEDELIESTQSEQDMADLTKDIQKLERDIMIQVKSLRDASDVTRPYIQADIDGMAATVSEKKKRLAELQAASEEKFTELNRVRDSIYAFEHFEENTAGKTVDEIILYIKSFIERIYMTQAGDKSATYLLIKGDRRERSYDDFFDCSDTSEYVDPHMCDSGRCRKLYS